MDFAWRPSSLQALSFKISLQEKMAHLYNHSLLCSCFVQYEKFTSSIILSLKADKDSEMRQTQAYPELHHLTLIHFNENWSRALLCELRLK